MEMHIKIIIVTFLQTDWKKILNPHLFFFFFDGQKFVTSILTSFEDE